MDDRIDYNQLKGMYSRVATCYGKTLGKNDDPAPVVHADNSRSQVRSQKLEDFTKFDKMYDFWRSREE